MLIRKKLTADEFSPPYIRYNEGTDTVQFSPDGGSTWVDQPELDPRTGGMYQLPPLTTDAKCRSAAGMTALVRLLVEARLNSVDAAELAAAVLGVVVFLPGFNILFAIILAFVTLALEIASTVLEDAFEGTTYDDIRCIFYCAIDADGVMDETAFDEAYAALIDLNAVARTWCQYVMNMAGHVGMTNAGIHYEEAADCDECPCAWCYTWLSGDGFSPAWSFDFGSYNGSLDRMEGANTDPVTGNTNLIQAKINFTASQITYFLVEIAYKSQDTFGGNSLQIGNGTTYGANIFAQITPTPTFTETTVALGGVSTPGELTDLWMQLGVPSKNSLDTYCYVTRVTIKGEGTNPFGETNCE